jgi:uncharacterized protein YjbJ (UPF0337 family)
MPEEYVFCLQNRRLLVLTVLCAECVARNVLQRTDGFRAAGQYAVGCGVSTGYPLCHVKVNVMNKDQGKGGTEQIKELAGKLVGDEALELEGVLEGTAGKLRSTYGDTKDRLCKTGADVPGHQGEANVALGQCVPDTGESSVTLSQEADSALSEWVEDGGRTATVPARRPAGNSQWLLATDVCVRPYRRQAAAGTPCVWEA